MSRIDKAIEMAAGIKASTPFSPNVDLKKDESTEARRVARDSLSTNNLSLVAANDPHGVVAEEYNKLRALVERLASNETRNNTLLITSAVSAEGKTLTAVNLALTMARTSDHMVFLIDADLRRPSIGKLLNIKNEKGLVHCLRDNLPLEHATVKTGWGKLAVLLAGQKVDDPLELLSSNHMQRLIEELRDRYPNSYCIFDSPPVLPFADARVMGPLMDNTVFVARNNFSRLNQVKEGVDCLLDCNVLGVLCNDSSPGFGRQYYGYY